MTQPLLILGNKNYSTWSMRPWLAMKWAGLDFDERVIALAAVAYGKSTIEDVLNASPSGRVPVLKIGDLVIHDSLAICEWAAEQAPSLWPADPARRAIARALAAEMHSSFAALRAELPMNIRRKMTAAPSVSDNAKADIARVCEAWEEAINTFGGPFLLGDQRSIADAMYAPVATRFVTYAIDVSLRVKAYCETIYADAAFQEWKRAAEQETWTVQQADEIYT